MSRSFFVSLFDLPARPYLAAELLIAVQQIAKSCLTEESKKNHKILSGIGALGFRPKILPP